jgi:ferritin-like metal-binding protein YciE
MGLFTKDIKTLDDLFVHTLQDIYYAEQQITKALPTMVEKATDPQLKAFKRTWLRRKTRLSASSKFSRCTDKSQRRSIAQQLMG